METECPSEHCLGTKMLVQEQGRWRHHSLKPTSSTPTSLMLWITKQFTENHSVPYVDLPPGRECTYQRTRRNGWLQSLASLYKLMNWHLIWNISLMSLVNVCLFHRDAAVFRANCSGFWDVSTQDGDEFTKVKNATLGTLNFSTIFNFLYFS